MNNIGLAITSVNELSKFFTYLFKLVLERTGEFKVKLEGYDCIINRVEWFNNKLESYIESVKSRSPNLPLE